MPLRLVLLSLLSSIQLVALAGENECTTISIPIRQDQLEAIKQWNSEFEIGETLEKTNEGRAYSKAMLVAHNSIYNKIYESCELSIKKAADDIFVSVAKIAADGTIEKYSTVPLKAEYKCIEKEMIGKKYPPPPSQPYYSSFLQMNYFSKSEPNPENIKMAIESFFKVYRDTTPNKSSQPTPCRGG